jgi:thiamine kinase-like enzyme
MCEAAVSALARLHAHWWNERDAGDHNIRARLHSNEEKLAEFFRPLLAAFFDYLGERLSSDQRKLLETVWHKLPELKQRRAALARPVTRTHGDPHFWNVLYPHDASRDGCVLIDWEDWRLDMGAADLAAMLVLHWTRERRSLYEDALLHHYLDVLRTKTQTDYDWNELQADYRLGHLQNIVVPIFQQHAGTPEATWLPLLERWFNAFKDLDCRQIL